MRYIRRTIPEGFTIPDIPEWMSAVLRTRGITSVEEGRRFIRPTLADLHSPFLMPDMEKAVSMIRETIRKGNSITVYGDYDADGVCASSILTEALRDCGARVDYYLPSRHTEGYGLHGEAIRKIAGRAALLITVDCGISNHREIALARELGLRVILSDHHELPEVLPEADAILHPRVGDYPCGHLCGAGVALKLAHALGGDAALDKALDLGAIATVADVVPLLDENRAIVREGIRRMGQRPGIAALLNSSGTQAPLCAEDLAFRIGPRLNAAGRLEDARLAAELLQTHDPDEAARLAEHLEMLNGRRQALERAMTESAVTQAQSVPDFAERRSIVVSGEGWNPGLIGLTAGRLCERYHRPVVALSVQGEQATGSCRSIPGVNIFEMLTRCGDLLEKYGGHAQAAGLTVRTERIEVFRQRLDDIIRQSCDPLCFEPEKEYDAEVPFGEWDEKSVRLMDWLEPTGEGNPPPVFRIPRAAVQSARRVGRDLSHLQLSLLDGGTLFKGIAFGMGEKADHALSEIDILYRPTLNRFRGSVSVEAQISAIESAGRDSSP